MWADFQVYLKDASFREEHFCHWNFRSISSHSWVVLILVRKPLECFGLWSMVLLAYLSDDSLMWADFQVYIKDASFREEHFCHWNFRSISSHSWVVLILVRKPLECFGLWSMVLLAYLSDDSLMWADFQVYIKDASFREEHFCHWNFRSISSHSWVVLILVRKPLECFWLWSMVLLAYLSDDSLMWADFQVYIKDASFREEHFCHWNFRSISSHSWVVLILVRKPLECFWLWSMVLLAYLSDDLLMWADFQVYIKDASFREEHFCHWNFRSISSHSWVVLILVRKPLECFGLWSMVLLAYLSDDSLMWADFQVYIKDASFREEHFCHWNFRSISSHSWVVLILVRKPLECFWLWSMVLLAYLSDDSLMWADFQVYLKDASFREEHFCHWNFRSISSHSWVVLILVRKPLECFGLWSMVLLAYLSDDSLMWADFQVYIKDASFREEHFCHWNFRSISSHSWVVLILVRKPLECFGLWSMVLLAYLSDDSLMWADFQVYIKDASFREEHFCHWNFRSISSHSWVVLILVRKPLECFWLWSMVLLAYLSDDSLMWADFQVYIKDASFREEHFCHWNFRSISSHSWVVLILVRKPLECFWLWSMVLLAYLSDDLLMWADFQVYIKDASFREEHFCHWNFRSISSHSWVVLILVRKPLECFGLWSMVLLAYLSDDSLMWADFQVYIKDASFREEHFCHWNFRSISSHSWVVLILVRKPLECFWLWSMVLLAYLSDDLLMWADFQVYIKDASFREEHFCHWNFRSISSHSWVVLILVRKPLECFWLWSMVLLAYLSDDSLMWADFQVYIKDASFREEHFCHWNFRSISSHSWVVLILVRKPLECFWLWSMVLLAYLSDDSLR